MGPRSARKNAPMNSPNGSVNFTEVGLCSRLQSVALRLRKPCKRTIVRLKATCNQNRILAYHMEQLTSAEKSTFIRSLSEAIQDIVFFKNPNGEYMYANHAFERLYGYTLEQIKGKSDSAFLIENEANYFAVRDKEAMEAGRPTVSEAWQDNELTGERECYETIKTPVFSEDGRRLGLLGIV